ncbi:hypothetical protein [Granulicella sp. S190]|uniref:hypothetical protein n=1 Tax=Granulicella sp. S190 TaxID=1747226 RepID=UPI00131D72B4|nr:hypothetical protein [Granulicella sp. S190]
MRNSAVSGLTVLLFASGIAFSQGTKLPIQQAIEAKYAVTKPTADHKDIVTAGAVIDLTKDNLIMYGVDSSVAANSTYKGGRFQSSGISKLQNWNNRFQKIGASNTSTNRTFVAGEKFWLIGVDVRDDGAVLEFLSDAISDVRYKAFVKYPFPNGTVPAPDVVMQEIGETIKAEPVEGAAKDDAKQPAPAAAAAAAPTPAMADIPPPPPPTDAPAAAPKSISLGQTKDEVAANFGQPTKIVKLPTKEIDYYPDMKVTFVKGKVSDVQ